MDWNKAKVVAQAQDSAMEHVATVLRVRLHELRAQTIEDQRTIDENEPKGKERNGEGMWRWYKLTDRMRERMQITAYKRDEVHKIARMLGVTLDEGTDNEQGAGAQGEGAEHHSG